MVCRWLLVLAWCALPVLGADYYVDNLVGDDGFDGLAKVPGTAPAGPWRTITLALRKAGAGDTVHLNPTGQLYREMADFYGLAGGEEGRPLVLDGHGATLCGADPAAPEGWESYREETVRRTDLVGPVVADGAMAPVRRRFDALEPGECTYDPSFHNRFYYRFPAGQKPDAVAIEVGQPDGTTVRLEPAKFAASHSRLPGVLRYEGLALPTWVRADGRELPLVRACDRLQPGEYTVDDGVLYYRPPAGRPLAGLKIEAIVRGNGVQMNGETRHVVVRNLNVTLVSNDGFNIHGHVTRAEFYNCNAWDTGDEGFSAHDTCETLLDGAVYTNNDNGIANVNHGGWSITRNVVLRRARSVGFLIASGARRADQSVPVWHELTNAILIDNPSQLSGGMIRADNLLVVQTKPDLNCMALGLGAGVTLSRATVAGNRRLLRLDAGSSAALDRVVLAGGQGVAHLRQAEPFGVWSLTKAVLAPGQIVQWGARPPWQEQPASAWLPAAVEHGIATGCELRETTLEQALAGGGEAGCTAELLERYRQITASDAMVP